MLADTQTALCRPRHVLASSWGTRPLMLATCIATWQLFAIDCHAGLVVTGVHENYSAILGVGGTDPIGQDYFPQQEFIGHVRTRIGGGPGQPQVVTNSENGVSALKTVIDASNFQVPARYSGRASARTWYEESFRIFDSEFVTLDDAVLVYGGLLLNFRLNGSVTGAPALNPDPVGFDGLGASWHYEALVKGSGGGLKRVGNNLSQQISVIGRNLEGYTYSRSISHDMSISVTWETINGVSELWYESFLGIGLENISAGSLEIDFGHSLSLESITFADGTTPEEVGLKMEFASGRPSPNLNASAVPEPSSMCSLV